MKVGRSRAVVANALRLLKLPAEVQAQVRDGRLSVGHAKVILGVTLPQQQTLAAARVLRDGLSVRQTEELVALMQKHAAATPGKLSVAAPATNRDAHIASIENQLRERFGTKVTLRYRQGKGSVEIKFFSDDELERVLQIAGVAID